MNSRTATLPNSLSRWRQWLVHTLGMIRFSHTVFALPFALFAAAMAYWAAPPVAITWQSLLGILLAMIFARSCAMAFNRLVDRHYDALNPRTASRHLPAGKLSVANVAAFAVVCCVGFVASTLLFLPNVLPLALSLPVLAFLCGYSYAKRFTSLAHLWLGVALALAPVATWIALRGEVGLPALVLAVAVALWVTGFDILYATQDHDFDRSHGLQSIPARVGVLAALRIAAGLHLAMVGALVALPTVCPRLGWIHEAGVALVALLLVNEHRLVRPDDLSKVNLAFFHMNAIISLGLFAVGCLDLWTG